MDDFSTILPLGIFDESGLFLEEPLQDDVWSTSSTPPLSTPLAAAPPPSSLLAQSGAQFADVFTQDMPPPPPTTVTTKKKSAAPAKKQKKLVIEEEDDDDEDGEDGEDGMEDGVGNNGGGGGGDDKAKKRRQQIAAASRASRARRKRELDDLRDENKRLREERSQFLTKIGELQMKVEYMRERGSTDMRVENELLRAQLEEHKRFVSCFKRLCDGAPSSLKAKQQIYKQGSDSAQAHVLGLISQSQHDDWLEAQIPDELEIPYSNFSMFYKFKQEYGTEENMRRRLNIRVDVLFPGMDCTEVSEFFWNSFSDTATHAKLYSVRGVEITPLAEETPDKDTKTVYFREKWELPKQDQDWVVLCNRKRRELPVNTLAVPMAKTSSAPGKVAAVVLAWSTTQHSAGGAVNPGGDRITSLFIQGCVTWNQGPDARLCCVFSLPDDVQMKAVESLDDVVNSQGQLGAKFGEVLKSFREMMGENGTGGEELI